ncbi:MAG: glucuronate isomerase, partial [Paracoccaceae bacterium]
MKDNLNDAGAGLYEAIRALPIVSPHGHTAPEWFAEDRPFADPAELLIIPDHYVFRMLYSQGVAMEDLGIGVPAEARDPRAIFRRFAANWRLFLGTPSRGWLEHTFAHVFGIESPLSPATADEIYDRIDAALKTPAFRPRALLRRFNIDVLATTDGALDDLAPHAAFKAAGEPTRLIPTFRPDAVLNPAAPGFAEGLSRLAEITGADTASFSGFLDALRARRAHFKTHGATATDHDAPDLMTCWLPKDEAQALLTKALSGEIDAAGSIRFYNHMLVEMAEMSVDDGLVMQIHAGNRRSTNQAVLSRFGRDMGADIPHAADWVHGLNVLLNRVGNDSSLHILAFTL